MYNFVPIQCIVVYCYKYSCAAYDCFCAAMDTHSPGIEHTSTSKYINVKHNHFIVVNLETHRYSQFAGLSRFPLRMKDRQSYGECECCFSKTLCVCVCVCVVVCWTDQQQILIMWDVLQRHTCPLLLTERWNTQNGFTRDENHNPTFLCIYSFTKISVFMPLVYSCMTILPWNMVWIFTGFTINIINHILNITARD